MVQGQKYPEEDRDSGRVHGTTSIEFDGVKTVVAITDRFRATGWNEKNEARSCSKK